MGRLLAVAAAAALVIASQVAGSHGAQADERQVLDSLKFESGTIPLGSNLASLALTPDFRYLSPSDTEKFLVEVWGNPPKSAEDTLGAIVPANLDLLGGAGWAIIISYDGSGHVSDDDAAGIDYDDLLREMQQATRDDNEERKKQGYESIELVGWAKPPYYDSAAKKLYWAKRFKFGTDAGETLNYSIRALGREGVLQLTVVASMDQFAAVDGRINEVLDMVAFKPGSTYAEFSPGVDKAAEYGIAGLIAGGILAKAGFFKVLIAGMAALWKPIAVGGVVVFGAIGKFARSLLGRRQT
jgi:uncharacterized membrane-anchored protein